MARHGTDDPLDPTTDEAGGSALVAALDGTGLDPAWLLALADRALAEDLGVAGAGWPPPGAPPLPHAGHDVTTEATVPTTQERTAHLVARADGVVAGLAAVVAVVAVAARRTGLPTPSVDLRHRDGDTVATGDVVAVLRGRTRVLLLAERTSLNLLSHASGVATSTRRWADALAGTGTTVLDTRKTTPGLRALEKHAVRCGGGENKRMGLADVAMVKDNHVAAASSVAAAFTAVRTAFPGVDVQVEVTSVEEAVEAVRAGARFLLVDNVAPEGLGAVVTAARQEAGEDPVVLEATGGITLERARDYAEAGVDHLSVGALTHSSPALDLALDLQP